MSGPIGAQPWDTTVTTAAPRTRRPRRRRSGPRRRRTGGGRPGRGRPRPGRPTTCTPRPSRLSCPSSASAGKRERVGEHDQRALGRRSCSSSAGPPRPRRGRPRWSGPRAGRADGRPRQRARPEREGRTAPRSRGPSPMIASPMAPMRRSGREPPLDDGQQLVRAGAGLGRGEDHHQARRPRAEARAHGLARLQRRAGRVLAHGEPHADPVTAHRHRSVGPATPRGRLTPSVGGLLDGVEEGVGLEREGRRGPGSRGARRPACRARRRPRCGGTRPGCPRRAACPAGLGLRLVPGPGHAHPLDRLGARCALAPTEGHRGPTRSSPPAARAAAPAPAEQEGLDQERPGHETGDVRPVGHAAPHLGHARRRRGTGRRTRTRAAGRPGRGRTNMGNIQVHTRARG